MEELLKEVREIKSNQNRILFELQVLRLQMGQMNTGHQVFRSVPSGQSSFFDVSSPIGGPVLVDGSRVSGTVYDSTTLNESDFKGK